MALSCLGLLLAAVTSPPAGAIRVKPAISAEPTSPKGKAPRRCTDDQAAALDAKEAAQMLSRFHQAHFADHILLFPGASPFWVYIAMRAHHMSPCGNSEMCKSFALSSDGARLRLNNFASLNSSWSGDMFTSGEMQAFFHQRGFRGQDGTLHPGKFFEWVKAKMCPYFESLGLKRHITQNKFILVDQTTSGLSAVGLAQVFKDCQGEWSATDAVLSEPVKFVNILDMGARLLMFPHSFETSYLQTVRVIGIATFEEYFHDDSPFGKGKRVVPACKMFELDSKSDCNNLDEADLVPWITRMKLMSSQQCLRDPHELYGLPHRVMSLPSFDIIARTLNQGSRMAQWADAKEALLNQVKSAQDSCESEPWCVLFRSIASGENWPIPDQILEFADEIAAVVT